MSPATGISGWSLQFTLRKNYGDPSPLLTKTIGSGITVTDSVNGVFKIAIADADTVNLLPVLTSTTWNAPTRAIARC